MVEMGSLNFDWLIDVAVDNPQFDGIVATGGASFLYDGLEDENPVTINRITGRWSCRERRGDAADIVQIWFRQTRDEALAMIGQMRPTCGHFSNDLPNGAHWFSDLIREHVTNVPGVGLVCEPSGVIYALEECRTMRGLDEITVKKIHELKISMDDPGLPPACREVLSASLQAILHPAVAEVAS